MDKAGNGSFDRIAKFIDTVKQIDNVTIQYESTFTKYHIRKGISRDEIASYMSKRFGIRGFVVDEMNVKEHKDAYSINNLENLPESFTSILWAISFKSRLYLAKCLASNLLYQHWGRFSMPYGCRKRMLKFR